MSKKIIENERRRQQMIKKRKLKRQKLIVRYCILAGGILIAFCSIKSIGHVIGKKNGAKNREQLGQESIVASVNLEKNETISYTIGENQVVATQESLTEGQLILVNDANPIRIYSDEEMVCIGDYLKGICQMKSTDIKLRKETAEALAQMLNDFNEVVGKHDLTIISGYRDFVTQEALHYESLQEGEKNEKFVARPDRSEHHTGLAVDFGLCYDNGLSGEYDGTGIYSWLNENCYKYGFIVRYDECKKDITGISHEPWHFRYVGMGHAQIIQELGLCLEEYIEFLKGYEYYTNPGHGITESTKGYSIYYVQSEGQMTNIPVPESKDYIISGNNKDGFIVTVQLNDKE